MNKNESFAADVSSIYLIIIIDAIAAIFKSARGYFLKVQKN